MNKELTLEAQFILVIWDMDECIITMSNSTRCKQYVHREVRAGENVFDLMSELAIFAKDHWEDFIDNRE